jgi:hypothetical protein
MKDVCAVGAGNTDCPQLASIWVQLQFRFGLRPFCAGASGARRPIATAVETAWPHVRDENCIKMSRGPCGSLTTKLATRIDVAASCGGGNTITGEVNLMSPKLLSAVSVALLLSLMSLNNANAEGGCGPGWHRNPWGHCRPNGGPVVVAPGPVVVAPAPVVVAPAPVVCGRGYRWHPGWRRCVVL